jgi:hypothetical protein
MNIISFLNEWIIIFNSQTQFIKNSALYYPLILCFAIFQSCKDDDGMSNVSVRLHDSPALYDIVKVEIESVLVHTNVSGWITLNS